MAVRNALQLGDPLLKASNREVGDFADSESVSAVADLVDSMRDAGLVGMAAPQIGVNLRLFVTEPRVTKTRTPDQADELRVYVNPRIVEYGEKKVRLYEGCGSVAHGEIFAPVLRPAEITIEAFALDGRKFRLVCDGLLARVIQHEYDHLDGIEFTEKIEDYRKLVSREWYVARVKDDPELVMAARMGKKECTLL